MNWWESSHVFAAIDGWDTLSTDFCNKPVMACTELPDHGEPYAHILLCGHLSGHEGLCDPIPPLDALA